MSETRRHGHGPRERPAPSANDLLKERWGSRLALSVMAAVLLHAALFLLRPSWVLPRLEPTGVGGPAAADALVAANLASDGGTRAGVAPAVGEPSDSTRDDGQREMSWEGPTGGGGASGSGSSTGSLRDRLGDLDGPSLARTEPGGEARPEPPPRSPAEPESEPAESGAATGSTAALSIGGRATTTEMADRQGEEETSLERLRALDPEVVKGLGSSEVLLRNPGEVVRFKETMVRRHPEVGSTEAWISVAIWVDDGGSVEWAEINDSSGREVLDEVALTLFSEVVSFRPALDDGDPVPKSMLFYLTFPW